MTVMTTIGQYYVYSHCMLFMIPAIMMMNKLLPYYDGYDGYDDDDVEFGDAAADADEDDGHDNYDYYGHFDFYVVFL